MTSIVPMEEYKYIRHISYSSPLSFLSVLLPPFSSLSRSLLPPLSPSLFLVLRVVENGSRKSCRGSYRRAIEPDGEGGGLRRRRRWRRLLRVGANATDDTSTGGLVNSSLGAFIRTVSLFLGVRFGVCLVNSWSEKFRVFIGKVSRRTIST